jgi:hypothetical protein
MNIYLFCFQLYILTLTSCSHGNKITQTSDRKEYCKDSSLSLGISKIEAVTTDSIIFELTIENHCKDSVIIMNNYTTPILVFADQNIRPKQIQTSLLYPSIDWEASSKDAKEYYINNMCRPLINNHNILFFAPFEIKKIKINIASLGYHGFKKNTQYTFFVSFDVSDQIKSYCPYVWSGFTKSPEYTFIVK